MNIKEEILKNSGILTEEKQKADLDNDFAKGWKGEVPRSKDFMYLGDMKCSICGENLGDDGGELRPHTGSIVGFRGKNFHRDCFSVPNNAKDNEKISFLDSDDESGNFVIANVSDDWDSSSDWSYEDED